MRRLIVMMVMALAATATTVDAQRAVYVDDNGEVAGTFCGGDRIATVIAGQPVGARFDTITGDLIPELFGTRVYYFLGSGCTGEPMVRSDEPGVGPIVEFSYAHAFRSSSGPNVFGAVGKRVELPVGAQCSIFTGLTSCFDLACPGDLAEFFEDGLSVDGPITLALPLQKEIRLPGDVSDDGTVDIVDVTVLRRQLAGLPVNLP